jgi:hypothetical protein
MPVVIPEDEGIHNGDVVLRPPELGPPCLQVECQLLVADADEHELKELDKQEGERLVASPCSQVLVVDQVFA